MNRHQTRTLLTSASKEEAKKPAKDAAEKSNTSADTNQSKQCKVTCDKSSAADKGDGDRVFSQAPWPRRIATARRPRPRYRLSGSGPHGRIVQRDVEDALSVGDRQSKAGAESICTSRSTESQRKSVRPPHLCRLQASMPRHARACCRSTTRVPNTGMRKTIAKRLTASARDVPHFNVSADIEMDAADGIACRKELNGREGRGLQNIGQRLRHQSRGTGAETSARLQRQRIPMMRS